MNFFFFNNDPRLLDVFESISSYGWHRPNFFNVIDIERIGKIERQNRKSYLSTHELGDLLLFKNCRNITCRINKFGPYTPDEVDTAISYGAENIILPYFKSVSEVGAVHEIIGGRVRLIPLFETCESLLLLQEIVDRFQIRLLHFGLNDLSLQVQEPNMVSLLDNLVWRELASYLNHREVEFGIGGIGSFGDNSLEKPPMDLIEKSYHYGANGVILARSFFKVANSFESVKTNFMDIYNFCVHQRLLYLSKAVGGGI